MSFCLIISFSTFIIYCLYFIIPYSSSSILIFSFFMHERCEVHEGFYLSSQSVKSKVIKYVQELQYRFPDFSVIVTGHSLGENVVFLFFFFSEVI